MNWDAVGALAELVSAIGVILTLVYLAIQIRENTKESRLASTSEISHQYNGFLQHITGNEELSKLWIKSFDGNPDALSSEERNRALMVMGNIIRILENAFLQHESGRMDDASWEGYRKLVVAGANSPLFTIYWRFRKEMHSREFSKLIEEALRNRDGTKMFEFESPPE